ncbi:MAG: SCO family protein [Candidatus Eremiobacteraeota bacterium]|nr:SCO family protein [Candidatus Eremiobacteraeota bacterium]
MRMRLASAARGVLLGLAVASAVVLASERAVAHEVEIRGLVLGIDGVRARAIVRVERGALVPAATVTFAVRPATALEKLSAGQTISATADLDRKPNVLSGIRVLGAQIIAGAAKEDAAIPAGVLRNVHHVATGEAVPDGDFLDQLGRHFTLGDLRGHAVVLAFVYTRCKDVRVCPLISAKFAKLQAAFRNGERLVEVTLDPRYDRPGVLASYAKIFGADPARWRLATGDPERVLDFAAQFQVTAFPEPRIGLIHAERTVVVDSSGLIRDLIDETSWTPDQLLARVRDQERLAANPFHRFELWLSAAAVSVCGNSVAQFSGFTDLAIVFAIFAGFGWLFYRIGRAIYRSAA